MVSFSALVLSVAATITGAKAHSWIHCSDYRGDVSNYEPEQCFGHPRPDNGKVPAMTAFGVDTGFNEQPNTSCNVGAAAPVAGYPMARYKQGSEVRLAWPSKNHVAAPCTNPFIPDTSLELFIAEEDADGHPGDFTQVQASFSDDPHVKNTIDYKGFQNCPAFCENMDKSLCTGTFTVPADIPDGVYTFQWKWVFNGGTAPYITCFEAYVGQDVAPGPQPTPAPTTEGQTAPPTVAVTQDECTLGMWAQCGTMGCCAGGATCFKQSDFYSQCRPDCPQGWECNTGTPNPTPQPTSVATPNPTPQPTKAPTDDDSQPCPVSDVTACPTGFSQANSGLQKPKGALLYTAVMPGACECAQFCLLFNPTSTAWLYKESSGKCTCYLTTKKVKTGKKGMWAGLIADL